MVIAYKIFDTDGKGQLKTLFHGIDGSRVIQPGRSYTAVERIVSDGGKPYLSGFHVLPTLEDCQDYLKRFKRPEDKCIVEVRVRKLRKKNKGRSGVLLARHMIVGNRA